MTGRLEGKVALVSGGARGMGASHARGIVGEGGRVVIGDLRSDDGKSVADELGDHAVFVELDVTDESSWEAAVRAAVDAFGGLDVLVNNAGISESAAIVEMPLEMYRRVTEVNQTGVFLGMKAAVVEIARRGGGSIINISSVAGLMGSPWSLPYTASKFAVRGMTKVAAHEFAPFGVRVNSIHPGFIRTPMLQMPGLDVATLAEGTVPLDRVAEPAEVTEMVLFLASSASSYCTGAEFVVDGGLMSGPMQPALMAPTIAAMERRLQP